MALKMAEAGPDDQRRQSVEIESLEGQLKEARRRLEVGVAAPEEVAKLESQLRQLRLRETGRDLERRAALPEGFFDSRRRAEFAEEERRLRDLTTQYEQQQRIFERQKKQLRDRALEARTRSELKEVAPERLSVRETLESQREALSGVSLDEEAVNLMRQQRAFQGAARVVAVVDELMRTILGMV